MGTRLVIDQLQREAVKHHMEAVKLVNHIAQAKREIERLRSALDRLTKWAMKVDRAGAREALKQPHRQGTENG